MTRYWLITFGVSLGLTLLIELGFALLCRKRGRALLLAALVNILTNPLAVLAVRVWGAPLWLAEGLVVLTEGFIYGKSREDFPRPYLFSLCANALSFGLGLLLHLFL